MTSPGDFPLLVFGSPTSVRREPLNPAPPNRSVRKLNAAEQDGRLGSKWQALSGAIEERRAALRLEVGSVDPELILVFETIGSVSEFQRAVRNIAGFEYLAELDEEVDATDFLVDEARDASTTTLGSLYLAATNRQALDGLLSLWAAFQADENARFPRGLAPWKEAFRYLVDVRRWGARDRVSNTGLEGSVAARFHASDPAVPVELELWFRADAASRHSAEERVRQVLESSGGVVLDSAVVGQIAYHALLATVPVIALEPLLEGRVDDIPLLNVQELAFARPEPQAVTVLPIMETELPGPEVAPVEEELQPLVALLDGVPVANHELLGDRVVFDDPEDWQSVAPAGLRHHGTAMASLVIHGDLGGPLDSLKSPVYHRPVLVPDPASSGGETRESVPYDRLPIDLVHSAVVRMLDPVTDGGARAPRVHLINLSLGDVSKQLSSALSPWARLLDFLSYEYNVLFVVSAGNHVESFVLDESPATVRTWTAEKIRKAALEQFVNTAAARRLLSPAEAINVLTVGAAHGDSSGVAPMGSRTDLFNLAPEGGLLPSPITAAGMGYKRAIKPDLLAPGGRLLYRLRAAGSGATDSVFDPVVISAAPGVQVAAAPLAAGSLKGVRYLHGTSCAAAITSHAGGRILEELGALGAAVGDSPSEEYWAVITKALLVHGARMPVAAGEVRSALGDLDTLRMRDALSRFYGYGVLAADPLAGAAHRATAVGWGSLRAEAAESYEFPLPPAMDGQRCLKRLVITLAYMAPINVRDRNHRSIAMYVLPDQDRLNIRRSDHHWQSVRRGTVQHEILSGTNLLQVVDGDVLRVQVNCRAVAGRVVDASPYAIAVTLESDVGVPVHAEVAARLQVQARARVRA